jgi:hypothetical protein
MGSLYFTNHPWLNSDALALALTIEDRAKDIVSYVIYAAELATSIVLLARVIGFSWLIATVAAQIYLYVLFPAFLGGFSDLQLVFACSLLRTCDGGIEFRAGIHPDVRSCPRLAIQPHAGAGFFALFISGFLSAPFTFIFAMPAYVVIGAVLVVTRRPSGIEWAWKIALLGSCLIFVFTSDLIDYFLVRL